MNRRKFLRNSALFSAPLFFNGMPVFAGNGITHPWLEGMAKAANYCNKVLVIVQLNGGNDGLNMVIPLDQNYANLNSARGGLMIPQSQVLSLTGTTATGLHPSMSGIQNLYNNGKITIVQGVSYPNPSYSHFQAQDIWFSSPGNGTGSASPTPLDTGWMGRDLDASYTGYPTNYPNTSSPDPLAIQIGGALPLSIQGPAINMGYNVPNPATLVNIANQTPAPAPASDYGTELTFLRMMKDQSNAYSGRISAAYNAQATMSTAYASSGNSLSDQLKVVARLVGGGLSTQVYIVNHPDSFDTHVNQVGSSTTTGTHANNLSKLSVAISAFMDDLTLMGKANKVAGMTFSEFGRRIISNTSAGTDHGSAAPVLFFGAAVNGGIIGNNPTIPATATSNSQVNTQYDFRQLYATVLQDWMCMSASSTQAILNTSTATNLQLPIFTTNPLPIKDISISAAWDGNSARVDFLVQDNDSYEQFVIERSADGNNYSVVGTIARIQNASAQPYRYSDVRISAPKVFYRIKGITAQGGIKYSPSAQLSNGARAQALSIYPNPVTNFTVHIDFLEDVAEMVEIEIYDMQGRRVFYNSMTPQARRLTVRLPDMMGTYIPYILRVHWTGNDVKEQISFI